MSYQGLVLRKVGECGQNQRFCGKDGMKDNAHKYGGWNFAEKMIVGKYWFGTLILCVRYFMKINPGWISDLSQKLV